MRPIYEAVVLPGIFLTVSLLGGFRMAEDVRLVPPPLVALVLAMLLVVCLVRGGVLRPERLMNSTRSPLENLSGLIVLLTLYAASAQVFNLVIPDTGLLHAVFAVFLFIQLLTMVASSTGRAGLLRSLVVLFGAAFVLRWIVLESLYAPDGGTLKRLLTVLAEGVTLGALDYSPHSAATGYVAFFALCLYMAGLALLPPGAGRALARVTISREQGRDIIVPLLLAVLAAGCGNRAGRDPEPVVNAAQADATMAGAVAHRNDALRSARVWSPPAVPVGQADLSRNPPGGFQPEEDVSCKFVRSGVSGTTPKFDCELPGGEIVKVKYGSRNAEIRAEVAATRLVAALGFAADRMYAVRKVRCAGCPPFPFEALKCSRATQMDSLCFAGGLDYESTVDFEPAVIERRLEGKKIEAFDDQGWAWFELDQINPDDGGASRAEADAFRLLAMLIAHWDNKSANQRLVCLPGGERPDGSCATPVAMMQDLGATFGPLKVDLGNWRRTAMWMDASSCTISMHTLPWGGATFPSHRVSEEGRLMLLGLLDQLTDTQLDALFRTSGITGHEHLTGQGRDARAWVRAFRDKVQQIRMAGPCPKE
jgi:hypothetical protein